MPFALYVCLQDEDKIATYSVDAASGRLTPSGGTAVPGGPSVMATSPDRQVLHVGCRNAPSIASFRINKASGGLTPLATAPQTHAPTFLAPDRSGRYMLCAYYQGGGAAVYCFGADGAIGTPSHEWLATDTGAHAIATDPSNRFAFVPHIARVQDNVLEPPKNIPGPNVILQFRFDAETGRLSPNTPARVEQPEMVGPRHYIHHPTLDIVYFSNEQGCSVTAYRLDGTTGNLSPVQTVSTLPAGHTERTTCSQIHLTPSGRFLYVGNRAPTSSSIAAFAADPSTGQLTPLGHAATEPVPSAFCLDPEGRFLFAVGTGSGRLASYRIDQQTGVLSSLAVEAVGQRPAAVAATTLG